MSFPLAEAAHAASELSDADAVRSWRALEGGAEPALARDELSAAIRRRSSVRSYGPEPLELAELRELLAWSEAPIPADAPRVIRQLVTVAAVEGLASGVYDAELNLLHQRGEAELRQQAGFAAMEQQHPKAAAVNVFQMADVERVVERLGDRGYRWAQLEAGIRTGRAYLAAVAEGLGATASTFFDDAVSRFLAPQLSPLLCVAVGSPPARRRPRSPR